MEARGTIKCFVLLFAAAGLTTANAALVNITSTFLPDLVTIPGYGAPTPSEPLAEKSTSQGAAQIFAWLQGQIPATDPAALNTILASGDTPTVGNLGSHVGDYLVVHWGNGPANKFFNPNPKGGFDEAFYISSAGPGSITLTTPSFTGYYAQGGKKKSATPDFGTLDVGGLSFWRIYDGVTTPVPEPTTMLGGALLLLPFGLQVVRYLRNRKPVA